MKTVMKTPKCLPDIIIMKMMREEITFLSVKRKGRHCPSKLHTGV